MAYKIIAPSTARTADTTFEVISNKTRTAQFIVDITAGAGVSDTITIEIDGYDSASGKWYTILDSAALNAVGTTILRVGMEYTASSNLIAKDFLPDKFRVIGNKNNATSITYSIGMNGLEE